MDKIKYKMKKNNKVAKDVVLEVSGITHLVSLREIETDVKYLEKARKEIDGMLGVEKAKMKNIENNHPWVKKLSEIELLTAFLYYESMAVDKEAIPKLKEINRQLKVYKKEIKDIANQTGLKAWNKKKLKKT